MHALIICDVMGVLEIYVVVNFPPSKSPSFHIFLLLHFPPHCCVQNLFMYVTEIEQDDKTFGIGRRRQRRQQQKTEKNGK